MQYVIKEVGGGWQVFESVDGREPYVKRGPRWANPADAGAFFDLIANMQYVSPLRAEPTDAPPSSSTLPEAANASRVPARTTEYPARRVVPKPDQGHGDKTGSSGGAETESESESELRFAFGDR